MNIHRGGLMVFDAELLKWQDPHAFYYVQRVFDLGSYLPPHPLASVQELTTIEKLQSDFWTSPHVNNNKKRKKKG